MSFSEREVKDLVRKVLLRILGPDGVSSGTAGDHREAVSGQHARPVVTEAEVLSVPRGSVLSIAAEALVTPLAHDTARERQVQLDRGAGPLALKPMRTGAAPAKTVALGADHGGYHLKEDLKTYLGELGYAVLDCGTHDTSSVDYADLAYAVARLVAEKRAWRGIMIDGAGIGSCMAANKVPGIRAAMCYDHATAVNSREHNDANVLTLGGMLLGQQLARQIARVWLETDFGGGRHARRVDKIMDIEKRYK